MRFKTLLSIVAVMSASVVLAAPPRVVYLYGATSMEQLKSANPNHYARAERIIAAADELCKPGPEEVQFAKFDAKEISCRGSLIKLSNPPKREIGFTLDEVRYVALVTLTDSKPEFRQVPDNGK